MAEGDYTQTDCNSCGKPLDVPIPQRQNILIKLNGTGGQWPAATIEVGDIVRAAFGKNAGAFQELNKSYEIKNAARPGNRLVAYVMLKIDEEPIT